VTERGCGFATRPAGAATASDVKLSELGHDCVVMAPSLNPRRASDRIKTDRRDAASLARLHRAGELTSVSVPEAGQEAMRDLIHARLAAAQALRRARQPHSGFLSPGPPLQAAGLDQAASPHGSCVGGRGPQEEIAGDVRKSVAVMCPAFEVRCDDRGLRWEP